MEKSRKKLKYAPGSRSLRLSDPLFVMDDFPYVRVNKYAVSLD